MSGLKTLEHVAVTVSITHPRRGSLELKLFCPSGMMSLIGAPRSMDSYVCPPAPSELFLATRVFARKRYRKSRRWHCPELSRHWLTMAAGSPFLPGS